MQLAGECEIGAAFGLWVDRHAIDRARESVREFGAAPTQAPRIAWPRLDQRTIRREIVNSHGATSVERAPEGPENFKSHARPTVSRRTHLHLSLCLSASL